MLAVLLGSGTSRQDVLALAKSVIAVIDTKNGGLALDDLASVSGMGFAKAAKVLAAFEFSRRRIRPEHQRIKSAVDVLPLLSHYADRKQEHFFCISLNGAHEVIATRVVSVGLVNCTQVHPREVFADPLSDRATAVIVAHNHPSGELKPSEADLSVTRRLKAAAGILGIELLDHVIFTAKGYFSFKENGLIS